MSTDATRADAALPCPLCGSTAAQIFDRQTWRGYPLVNLICEGCGLVYQGGDSPARRADFYEHAYRQVYQGGEAPTAKDLAMQRQRGEHLARFLRESGVQKVGRHLDVGASAGLVLQAVQAEYGSQPVGVEPGQAYRELAAQSGIPMYPSIEALEAAAPEHFNLISLSHVLEHLPDPVGTLRGLRQRLLSTDGRLLLEVPNLYAHDSFELAHLLSFSPHSLTQVVRQAGFEVLTRRAHGEPRSSLLPLYITLLAVPLPETAPIPAPRRESGVGGKRRLGMLTRRALERLLPGRAWRPLPDSES